MRAVRYAAAGLLSIGTCLAQTDDMPVDVELLLAVDVSGSMDSEEHAVQRQGYLEAIVDAAFLDAVAAGFHGRIAVAYMEWAGPSSQVVVVPWRLIEGPETAAAFAEELASRRIALIRGTSISGALDFGTALFVGNGFDGVRRVIDVSGDGANRAGRPATTARDAAVAAGFVINGLPIMIRPSRSAIPLDRYYWDCVSGGTGSFVLPVSHPDELVAAIRRKLVLEVAGAPNAAIIPVQAGNPVDCAAVERSQRYWEP